MPAQTESTPAGNRRSILLGLVGTGIARSRTPAMHEAEGRALGLPLAYRLLDTDRGGRAPKALADLLDFAEFAGFDGLNVTFPFKQAVMPLLTGISREAEVIGAVNTVIFDDGRRIGHNTDYWGFRTSFLQAVAEPKGLHVLLVGAGGAGVAVAKALADSAIASLDICDADAARADTLAARLTTAACPVRGIPAVDAAAAARADVIVNATPVGMDKLPGTPFDTVFLDARHIVFDIIYFPLETELLRAAVANGSHTVSGEGMAVGQAVKAFELFTGTAPDAARMRETFRAFDRPAQG